MLLVTWHKSLTADVGWGYWRGLERQSLKTIKVLIRITNFLKYTWREIIIIFVVMGGLGLINNAQLNSTERNLDFGGNKLHVVSKFLARVFRNNVLN